MFSFQDIGLWGMTAMMSPLSEERARASQWARIGAMLGGLFPNLIQPILGFRDKFSFSLSTMFFVCAVLFCFCGSMVSMLAYNAKERVPAPPNEDSFIKNLRVVKDNHMLLLLLLGNILERFRPSIDEIYVYQEMDYNVFGKNMTGELASTIFGAVSEIPGAAGMFFATKVAKRIGGMRNVLFTAKGLDILTRVIRYFIGYKSFGRLAAMYFVGSVASIPKNMTGIASTALWGDSIDYLEWKTGKRTEGIAFSLQIFIEKMGASIGSLLKGLFLGWMDYDEDLAEARIPQTSEKFKKWVWPLHQLGPIVGIILYIICVLCVRYPAETKMRVEKELAERRAARMAESGESNGTFVGDDVLGVPK
ncbi:MAG: MFS transporter [Oscillospiraceae bacterium]|nr:MFS transporter [Oscillospiraceae bacterium]